MIIKALIALFKISAFLVFAAIVAGRLFFPQLMQQKVIEPVRRIPVMGSVLGLTWDTSGDIVPLLTKKTVNLADKVEYSDLGINEAIESVVSDHKINQSVSQLIEQNVQSKLIDLKNLPDAVLDKAEAEIRSQLYQQICSNWQATPGATRQ